MIDPQNPQHLDELAIAISTARWLLEPFRVNRMKMLQQYVGGHYSNTGSNKRVPLNLLKLAADIYLRQLIPQQARAMCGAKDPQLKPVAADMEAWMDKAAEGMRLTEAFRITVLNAIFSIGIMKVGEAHVDDIEILGTLQHVGQPFAEPVDLDDFAFDITAKRLDQCQFIANRSRVPLEEAQNDPMFDPVERAKLVSVGRSAYNERGDLRVTTLSQSTAQLQTLEVEEHCELWEVFLPREQLVLTMPYQDSTEGGFAGQKPLRIVQWKGPRQGPYVILTYGDVPNNVMPAAPAQALVDLHEMANGMWRKLFRQADRQKTVLTVSGGATDDAARITNASDGEAVKVDQIAKLVEFSTGGIAAENMVAAEQVKQLFVYMAGNLDAMGGLSPQSATLGQDRLLSESSSAQIRAMAATTHAFIKDVFGRLAWHWWSNPHLTYETSRQVGGQDIPVSITPQMRQAPFEKLDFSVDPYSLQEDTPETRLSRLKDTLQTVLLPLAPMLAQQGVTLKGPELLKLFAKYGNEPDLADILAVGPPPDQQGPTELAHDATKPAVTQRTNTRISRPGMTQQGHGQVLQQLLAGGGQPKQAAGMGRPIG